MPGFRSIVGILLIVAGLSGCGLCPEPDGLAKASTYGWRSTADSNWESSYTKPLNTWVDNPELTAFLRKVVEQEGRPALVSSYGFQCQAAPTPDCHDCSSCTRTMNRTRNNLYSFVGCVNDGVMRFQVNVGPGSRVRAMTYWQQ